MNEYKNEIRNMLITGTKRLVVSLDRLRDHNIEETSKYGITARWGEKMEPTLDGGVGVALQKDG